MSLYLRKAEPSDIGAVKKLEIDCHLSSWAEQDYLKEFGRPDSIFYVMTFKSEVIGFILARLIMFQMELSIETEIEIYNIAVENSFRRRKVGATLLEKLFETGFQKNADRIFLEVRKSNTEALDFYKKNSFKVTGERKNFYRNPSEDAVLMCHSLQAQKVAELENS